MLRFAQKPLGPGRLAGQCRSAAVSRTPELEEFGLRAENQRVAIACKRGTVGFQALVELVELRVLAIGIGIDAGGDRLALTHDGLSFSIGLRQHFLTLTIGLCANPLAVGST